MAISRTQMGTQLRGNRTMNNMRKYKSGGKLKMVEKGGKQVPFYAADGKGAMKKGGKVKKYQAGSMVSPDERAVERGNAAMDRISEEGTTNMMEAMEAKDPRSMRPKKRPTDPRSMKPKARPTSKPKSALKPTRDGNAMTTKSLLQPRADGTGLTTKPEKMKAGGMMKKKGYAKGGEVDPRSMKPKKRPQPMTKKQQRIAGVRGAASQYDTGTRDTPASEPVLRQGAKDTAKRQLDSLMGGSAKKALGMKAGGKVRGYGMARGGKACKIR